MKEMIPIKRIENKIYMIRRQKVMLDFDLAALYGVPTKVLNQAVRRNLNRFPDDFMFSLTRQEIINISQIAISSSESQFEPLEPKGATNLKSQFVTSSWGGRRKKTYAFTENGVAMLSSVLHSGRAIKINIQIMRAFTRLRQIVAKNKDISYLFKELKHKVDQHDNEIGLIIRAIEKMIAFEKKPRAKIGFNTEKVAG